MKFQSQIIASGSGSIGGCTYSRNRWGQYVRRRAMPVFPATSFQATITNAMASLLPLWRSQGTLVQEGWNSYALTCPRTDALGSTYYLTGQGMFIACNTLRIQLGAAVSALVPGIAGIGLMTVPGITSLTATTRVAIITFLNTDNWANGTAGRLAVYSSRPQSLGVNFFKGPFRLAGTINGAGTPPTSPQNVTTPFQLSAGQRVFFRFRATDQIARLTNAAIPAPVLTI